MAKAFDATLNTLIDAHVADWAGFLAARCGVPPGPATVLDTDLSATLQADRLFRIDGPTPAAVHLELESTGRLGIPDELLRYNVAARAAVDLPVHSVLMLLRPKATATDLTGQHDIAGANGVPYLTFRYSVVRLWQESFSMLLAAGPGVTPLALLTNEAAADLPAAFGRFRVVVQFGLCGPAVSGTKTPNCTTTRFRHRLQADRLPVSVERSLLGSTFVLCGLRYTPSQIESLYRDLSMTLEDSTTYQLILNKGMRQGEARGEARGRAAEAQSLVLTLGTQRFGRPEAAVEAALRAISDRERLERIATRLLTATDWNELLSTP